MTYNLFIQQALQNAEHFAALASNTNKKEMSTDRRMANAATSQAWGTIALCHITMAAGPHPTSDTDTTK